MKALGAAPAWCPSNGITSIISYFNTSEKRILLVIADGPFNCVFSTLCWVFPILFHVVSHMNGETQETVLGRRGQNRQVPFLNSEILSFHPRETLLLPGRQATWALRATSTHIHTHNPRTGKNPDVHHSKMNKYTILCSYSHRSII